MKLSQCERYVLLGTLYHERNLSVNQGTSSCCTNKEGQRPIDRQRVRQSGSQAVGTVQSLAGGQ